MIRYALALALAALVACIPPADKASKSSVASGLTGIPGARGCFDPVDYGAAPILAGIAPIDSIDSRPGIQRAIDEASFAGRGRVCIGDGDWFVTRAPVGSYNRFAALSTHGTGVELAGTGQGTARIVAAGDAGAFAYYIISLDPGARDISIHDLAIDTTGLTNTDAGEQTHAIAIGTSVCSGATCSLPVANVSVQRVAFKHAGPPGARWGDCVRVAGNTPATRAQNIRLVDLDLNKCGRSGIALQRNADAVTVANSHFDWDEIGGTPFDGEATGGEWDEGLVVSNNQIWRRHVSGPPLGVGDTYAIALTSQRGFTVTGNVVRGGRGCVTAVRILDGTISNNTCASDDATATAALVDVANLTENVAVTGNTLRRSGGAGHCIRSQARNGFGANGLTITGNTCVNATDGSGVMLLGGGDVVVAGNRLLGNGGSSSTGVYATPLGETFDGLVISGNLARGMAFSAVRLAATGGRGFVGARVDGNVSRLSGPLRCDNGALNTPAGSVIIGANSWSAAPVCVVP